MVYWPLPENYRCYCCISSSSGQPIDACTVELIPHDVPFPLVTADEYLHQAAVDIPKVLQNKNNKIPSFTFGNHRTNAFIQLAQVLKRATNQNENSTPLIVVPKRDPLSSLRVIHNVAPSKMVRHNNVVPLVVPNNNPVSSPRVHQTEVTPLEVVCHNNMV